MENQKQIIAENIKKIRESLSLTQTEFAEKLNYSDKAISKWERGESLPDILVLKEICDLAFLPLDYLVYNHSNETLEINKQKFKRRHIIITLLCVGLVWLVGTFVFLVLNSLEIRHSWLTFIGSGVISEIVLLVFNSIWGKHKLNYIIISLLIWNILVLAFFLFFSNSPLMFCIGIPGQIIVILWSLFKPIKRKTEE